MAQSTVEIKVKISWWFLHLYLPVLKAVNWFTVNYINADAEPDTEKVKNTALKAIKLYSNGKRI